MSDVSQIPRPVAVSTNSEQVGDAALRSLTTDAPFRGLGTRPFTRGGESCTLGKRTVIYGRNGSGKTTFSELLRLASDANSAESVSVIAAIRSGEVNRNVQLGTRDFPWKLLVYNRYYVDNSLKFFLDGDGQALPILKLGASSVATSKDLDAIRSALARISSWRQVVEATRSSLIRESEAIAREVKSNIISALAESDPAIYNTTRFQITRAKTLLHETTAAELSEAELQREIEIAKEQTVAPVRITSQWPVLPSNLTATINDELLGVAVESQSIDRLLSAPALAEWVERGLSLHKPGDLCAFCQEGRVSTDLLTAYAEHFSEALNALRKRLRDAVEYLTDVRERIDQWIAAVPSQDLLLVEYRDAIQTETEKVADSARNLQAQIESAIRLVKARLSDPLNALPPEQRLTTELAGPDLTELNRLVNVNNEACGQQLQRRTRAREAVEQHYGAAQADSYRHFEDRTSRADRALKAFERRESTLLPSATELEQSQQDTGRMANDIDTDLREHFGYGYLKISVSEDGKGYVVKRGKKFAKRLSEGERNAIAFSYFLRSLEEHGVEPRQTVVIIDDPVTSMDKESLFAAFALAEERTKAFGQAIFLTHDYEYFRLQLNHLKSRRERSEKKIRENNRAEEAFPTVSILEISAALDPATGQRTSSLRKLPKGLLQHSSEYHYLFRKVAEAVAGEDSESLPLLGNAARRLLDGFIAFRAPNGNDFQARVDSTVQDCGVDETLARRIVKFLHGQSHRENPSPTSALDFPSIEAELKEALEFMRQADGKHFAKMCKAVEIEEAMLSPIVQQV